MRWIKMAAACLAAFPLAAPASAETVVTGQRIRVPTVAQAGPTILNSGRTLVKLRRTGQPRPGRPSFALITINGLAFDSNPGVMYEVYLQSKDSSRVLLGLINFYTQTAPGYGGKGAIDARALSDRSFDATEAFRRLGRDADILVFVPTSGVTGPAVQANPRARVRFRSAIVSAR